MLLVRCHIPRCKERDEGVPQRTRGSAPPGLVAILSVLLVLTWSAARVHFVNGGNWTALFCAGADFPEPPELEAITYRIPLSGYDGQFYRLLAHDPTLTRHYARYVDAPQFRFRRCLVPLAAWLLAFGQQSWIDSAYIAVEMLFVGLGVYWCARLVARRGRSPIWGLLFLAVPATLASFDRMLVDGPLTALFAGFMWYSDEERWDRVWVVAMLAGLTRETGLLLSAALVVDRLLRRDWRSAIRFAACGIPALAWYAFLAIQLPPGGSSQEIGIPVWGLLQRWLTFRGYSDPVIRVLLQVTDFLALSGLIACLILAAFWLRKRVWDPVTISVALYGCLTLIVGPPVLESAFAYGRVVSPLLLWVAMEGIARKKWAALAPPLFISLSVSLVFGSPLVTIGKALLGR